MGTQEKGARVGGACASAAWVGIRTEGRSWTSQVAVADLKSSPGKEIVIYIFYFHCGNLNHPSLVLDGCLVVSDFALVRASQPSVIII